MEAQLQQALVEQSLLQVAKHVEDQLDAKLQQMDNLDEDDLEGLRQRRVQQLKRQAQQKQEWLSKGHGQYQEIFSEKDFFKEMKGAERFLCHFFRDNWPCKVMDKHLGILAQQHVETKFVKIHAEKSPYLTEKLRVFMLPTLALCKREKVEGYVVGLDELGGTDDFPTSVLADRLAQSGMIWPADAEDYGQAPAGRARPAEPQRAVRQGARLADSDEDSDFG